MCFFWEAFALGQRGEVFAECVSRRPGLSCSRDALFSWFLRSLISWSLTFTRFTRICWWSGLSLSSLSGDLWLPFVGDSTAFSLASSDYSRTSFAVTSFAPLFWSSWAADPFPRESLNLYYIISSSFFAFSALSSSISLFLSFSCFCSDVFFS